jgi:hypothetical protein
MEAWLQSETFWLNVTNVALGILTLVCLLVVGYGVVLELLPRLRRRSVAEDDHAVLTPELGLTMADGGRRIDARKPRFWRRRR